MSRQMFMIQIVPSLSPVIDGIGDYALQLARQLRARAGVETAFLVCDPAWPGNAGDLEFEAVGLEQRREAPLLDAVAALGARQKANAPILLHFSPYGYQKRGCPAWLVSALEKLNTRTPGRINTAFHELDVESSRVLSSAYWVPGVQRFLMRRLLRISAFAYTNTGLHQSKLQAWGRRPVPLIPNFSNIGELDAPPPAKRREREVVIFGRADQRRWTYTRGADALAAVCEGIAATRIVDVGAPIPEHTCTQVCGVPVVRRGLLPAEEVAATMRSALANFMFYPVPLLTKSGVHALACASGTVSFISSDSKFPPICQGLAEGLDYFVVKNSSALPPLAFLEGLAPAIYQSYRKRASSVAALTIAEHLYGDKAAVPDLFTSSRSTAWSLSAFDSTNPEASVPSSGAVR